MVQELQVLRCFSCETFQSQIVKKSNKWECKMCGINQSVKKIYGRGSGKDCRIHTQKLNALRGKKEEIDGPHQDDTEQEAGPTKPPQHAPENNCLFTSKTSTTIKTSSKWVEFMDENETIINRNDSDEIEETTLVPNVVTYKSKTQKRKINYGLDNGNSKGHFVDDENFSDTYLPDNTKKVKSIKSDVVKVDCHKNKNSVFDGDIRRTNRESQGELLICSQSNLKPCGKWAEYLGKEDKVQILNVPSQNLIKTLQNNYCKESLTWDDCLEKEDLKKDTTLIHSFFNHRLNKSINESTNYIKFEKRNEKYEKSLGDNFAKIPKHMLECDGNLSLNSFEPMKSTETCDFKVKTFDCETREEGLVSNKLLKSSLIHFDGSKKPVKSHERDTSNNSSHSACCSSTQNGKHFSHFDSKHVSLDSKIKYVNSSFSDLLETNNEKSVVNSVKVNFQEKKLMNAGLPVFEQNDELSDSHFLLDF